ncbi:hypothetical protein [Streptomyces globosus]|uniref:hypothetical protein n=1 Tax=Streptomyces globosus TaxID=68209 RepID=UPI0013B39441|nr:hypothetical protein [Streptomyces globosus]
MPPDRELLRAEGEPLAKVVADLPYHGPRTCTATCVSLLDAGRRACGSRAKPAKQ